MDVQGLAGEELLPTVYLQTRHAAQIQEIFNKKFNKLISSIFIPKLFVKADSQKRYILLIFKVSFL
jgi:hypothetical protein